jgi:hypothetical protein
MTGENDRRVQCCPALCIFACCYSDTMLVYGVGLLLQDQVYNAQQTQVMAQRRAQQRQQSATMAFRGAVYFVGFVVHATRQRAAALLHSSTANPSIDQSTAAHPQTPSLRAQAFRTWNSTPKKQSCLFETCDSACHWLRSSLVPAS